MPRVADRRVHLGQALQPLVGLGRGQGQVLGRDLDAGDVLVLGQEVDLLGGGHVQHVDALAELAGDAQQPLGRADGASARRAPRDGWSSRPRAPAAAARPGGISSSEWKVARRRHVRAAPSRTPASSAHQQGAGRGAHEHLDPAAARQPLQLAQAGGRSRACRRRRRRGRSASGPWPAPACRPAPRRRWWSARCWASRRRPSPRPAPPRASRVSRSSFHSRPGSRKCTWVSMTPGRTVRPRGVEHLAGRGLRQVADGGDLAVAHADVGQAAAGVVHHLAAAHDQVEGLSGMVCGIRSRSRRRASAAAAVTLSDRQVHHVAERLVRGAGRPR